MDFVLEIRRGRIQARIENSYEEEDKASNHDFSPKSIQLQVSRGKLCVAM